MILSQRVGGDNKEKLKEDCSPSKAAKGSQIFSLVIWIPQVAEGSPRFLSRNSNSRGSRVTQRGEHSILV